MGSSAGTVLQRYYELREKHGGKKPPRYFRKGAWKHAGDFLAWCVKAGIENPLGFLQYRFEAAEHTGYVPTLIQLRSNHLAELWHSFKEADHDVQEWSDRMHAKAGSREKQQLVALRILTPGHEAVKQPYRLQAQEALCLASIELSGGYHPESRWCPQCPKAVECAAALYRAYGFDVVSLRAGRLHALPREVAAALVS